MDQHHLSLFVTGACSLDCPECTQKELRRAYPDYHMSIAELEAVIAATKESGYPPFRPLVLSGGESLLWKHLPEGLALLRQSGIARTIQVFTNGLHPDRVTAPIMRNLDRLRISRYAGNLEQMRKLKRRWPRKVRVVDRRRHLVNPRALMGVETLPMDCGCRGYAVFHSRVYACPNLLSLSLRLRIDLDREPGSCCAIQPGYIEMLLPYRQDRNPFCRACISNRNVRRILEEGLKT